MSSRRFFFSNKFYFYFHSPKVTCQINLIFIVNIRFVLCWIESRRCVRVWTKRVKHTQSYTKYRMVLAFFPSPSACISRIKCNCMMCAQLVRISCQSIGRFTVCSNFFSVFLFVQFNSFRSFIFFLGWRYFYIYIVFFHSLFVVVSLYCYFRPISLCQYFLFRCIGLLLACAPSRNEFMYSFRFRVMFVMVDVRSPHFIIVMIIARHLGIIIVIESFHL